MIDTKGTTVDSHTHTVHKSYDEPHIATSWGFFHQKGAAQSRDKQHALSMVVTDGYRLHQTRERAIAEEQSSLVPRPHLSVSNVAR